MRLLFLPVWRDIPLGDMGLRLRRLIALVHTAPKLMDTCTEPPGKLGKLLAAEEKQDYYDEENHFAHIGHTKENYHI